MPDARRRTTIIVETIPTTTTVGMTVPKIMNRVLFDEGASVLSSILIVVDRVVEVWIVVTEVVRGEDDSVVVVVVWDVVGKLKNLR